MPTTITTPVAHHAPLYHLLDNTRRRFTKSIIVNTQHVPIDLLPSNNFLPPALSPRIIHATATASLLLTLPYAATIHAKYYAIYAMLRQWATPPPLQHMPIYAPLLMPRADAA